MKILVLIAVGLIFTNSIDVSAATSIKITVKTYENAKRIVRLYNEEDQQVDPEVGENWKMEKQKFSKLVSSFLELPGTTDTILKCPRNYIQFDYSKDNLKRREFVCYEKSNSTRKKYIAFAKKII